MHRHAIQRGGQYETTGIIDYCYGFCCGVHACCKFIHGMGTVRSRAITGWASACYRNRAWWRSAYKPRSTGPAATDASVCRLLHSYSGTDTPEYSGTDTADPHAAYFVSGCRFIIDNERCCVDLALGNRRECPGNFKMSVAQVGGETEDHLFRKCSSVSGRLLI